MLCGTPECHCQQQSGCKEDTVIGPALETFLTVIGIVLLVLAGVGLLTKPFWKRIATFFRRWWERDLRAEQLRREEVECRRKAQQEVSEFCHDDILKGKAPTPPVENLEKQAGTAPVAENGTVSGQAAAPPSVATLPLIKSSDLQKERPQEIQIGIKNGLHGKQDQEREQK